MTMTHGGPSPMVAVIAAGSDAASGSWLTRALRRWRTPRHLVRHRGLARRVRVVDPDEASFLVVVCSPLAKADSDIDAMVTAFAARADRDRVIALLVDGDPDSALPAALYRHDGSVPLAADVRSGTPTQRRQELLRLVAPMLGCAYDDLRRRDNERRVRRLGFTAGVVLGVAALLGVLSGLALQQANAADDSRRELEETRARADGMNRFINASLFEGLIELDRLDILRPSTEAQMAFYRDLPLPADPEERLWRTLAVRRHAVVLSRAGESDEALATLEGALEILEAHPSEPRSVRWGLERVRTLRRIVEVLGDKGDVKRALATAQAASDTCRDVMAVAPSPEARRLAFDSLLNLGHFCHRTLDYEGAEAAYVAAEAELEALRDSGAITATLDADLLNVWAVLDGAQGDTAGATQRYEAAVVLWRAEVERQGAAAEEGLALALRAVGEWRRGGRPPPERALGSLEEALAIQRRLAAGDPTNVHRRMAVADTAISLARALDDLGRDRRSASLCQDALATYRQLRSINPRARAVLLGVLSAAERLARVRRDAGDRDAALDCLEEAFSTALELWAIDPNDGYGPLMSATISIAIAELQMASGDVEQVLRWIAEAERIAEATLQMAPDNPALLRGATGTFTSLAFLLSELGHGERAAAARLRAGELALRSLELVAGDAAHGR